MSHQRKHLFGQPVELVKHQGLRHAGPLHAHDQMIDAGRLVELQHLLRHFLRRPEEKTVTE